MPLSVQPVIRMRRLFSLFCRRVFPRNAGLWSVSYYLLVIFKRKNHCTSIPWLACTRTYSVKILSMATRALNSEFRIFSPIERTSYKNQNKTYDLKLINHFLNELSYLLKGSGTKSYLNVTWYEYNQVFLSNRMIVM